MKKFYAMGAFLGTFAAPGVLAAAEAPSDDSNVLQEVVVTAQKREENMQDVPIAITAMSKDQLATSGVTDTFSLKSAVPGLDFSTALGSNALPNIRGVGTGAGGPGVENPVALYIDGVYIASGSAGLLALNDIEQVAVLKGPQGTLFGRNATGGLIQITTRAPLQELAGDFHLTGGNLGTYGADAYVTDGLADNLAASLSLHYTDQQDGFGKNVFTGNDVNRTRDFAGRTKLLWTPGDDTRITLALDRSERHFTGPNFVTVGLDPAGQPPPADPWDIKGNFDPRTRFRQQGANVTVQHDFGEAVRLLSITAYRDSKQFLEFDSDLSTVDLTRVHVADNENQFSQELQLQSVGGGKLNWVAGLYYFDAEGKYDPFRIDGPQINFIGLLLGFPPGAQANVLSADQKTKSYAGFAQATYEIFPDTHFTGGIRYTTDEKDYSAQQNLEYSGGALTSVAQAEANKRFGRFSYRASLDHRFSPELLAYLSFNTGFKSGLFSPPSVPAQLVNPEYLTAYEAGIKTDLFGHRVRFNLAGYYYDYTNIQVLYVFRGVGFLSNGSGAETYGLDGDLTWAVTRDLTVTGGFSWLHGRYKAFTNANFTQPEPAFGPCPTAIPALSIPAGGNCQIPGGFDATGNKLQLVPDYTVNVGFNYDLPVSKDLGRVSVSTHYYYNDGWFADPQNRAKQDSYEIVDAAVTWTSPGGQWDIRLWGDNLGNEAYAAQLISNDAGDQRGIAPGRTYGVTAGLRF